MDELARAATQAHEHLADGSPEEAVRRRLPPALADEAVEVARARIDGRERFPHAADLFFDAQGLRYATPEVVADARARRIADDADEVADLACGVGIQLAFLARHCQRAVGVEIDARRVDYAERNLAALGAHAQVIRGDALSPEAVERVGDVDAVFCDPARAPAEPERTFGGLSPDPRRIVEAYAHIPAFAFELPPQMPPERITAELDGEVEYTSLGFELNRACLYTGPLAHAGRSAVALPGGARIVNGDSADPLARAERASLHVHEVDPAVRAAGLLAELADQLGDVEHLHDDGRRCLLTGPRPSKDPFVRSYAVLDVVRGAVEALPARLRAVGAGSVTLRFSVDPKEYWNVRNQLEADLEGDLRVHLFRTDDAWLVVEEEGG